MRPVSDTWKNSIYENRKALLLKADMLLMSGETLYLDYEPGDDDFMADGLIFEDATSNEISFDVGNAVMNTFSFRLNNSNDKYTNKILADAVITPYVGMELSGGETEWVKKGKFTVSDPGKRGSILSFTAYDFMQKLETAFSSVKITYPVTIGKMAQAICTACGVTLATTTFPNSTYVISEAPAGSNYSCRQIISFIAQIAGCFARFNADGELEIKWYEAVDTESQNYHDITQYKTLETELKDITITGVRVSSYYNENSLADENGNPVVENAESGSGGYMVSISNNPLIPYGKASQVANMLAGAIVGTTFRPLNLTTFFDPSMEAGDTAVVTDIKGNTYSFFVTNMTAKVGSDVKIICSAQTESDNLAEQYTGAAQVVLAILEATNAKFKDLTVNHLESLVGEFGFVKTHELEAEIGKFGYITADEAAIKYATITDLKATNATIQNLTAIAITTENLEAEVAALGYATIDFANIDTAHINREKVKELFVELGMIKDAVISEGHITGYLDAVKVNANDIKTGTLSTDRLIINGSDQSIVFALNNMGALVSTSVDSLDGGILTERTVTADKIVSHSITSTEITTENIIGANGWINLALGTFNYGNKLSWDGTNLEIVGAVTITSLADDVKTKLDTAFDTASETNEALIALCVDGNTTYIDGSKIYTGSVTADKISVDSLEAIVAKIGGFNINDTALYNGTDSMISTTAGVYLGIDGIRQYKSADAYVNIQDGVLDCVCANIKGSAYIDNGLYLYFPESFGVHGSITEEGYYKVINNDQPGSLLIGFEDGTNLELSADGEGFLLARGDKAVIRGFTDSALDFYLTSAFHSGVILLDNTTISNNKGVCWNNSDGTGVQMAVMSSSDYMYFGNSSYRTYLRGNALYLDGGTTYFGGTSYYIAPSGNAKFGAVNASYIELSMSTPYIDFHYGSSTADYTSRIIERESGTLSVQSANNSTVNLEAYSTSGEARLYANFMNNDSYPRGYVFASSTEFGLWCRAPVSKGLIYCNKSGTVTSATSDRRLKNDLGNMPMEEALTILKGVKIHNFTYKADTNKLIQNGIIAQELRDLLISSEIGLRPYLTLESTSEDKTEVIYDINIDEEKVLYGIDYSKFTPLLWKGWQYHDDKIFELEEEIKILQALIAEQAIEINNLRQAYA